MFSKQELFMNYCQLSENLNMYLESYEIVYSS